MISRVRKGMPILLGVLFLLSTSSSRAGEKARPIQVDDLFRLGRVADPQISPDGKHVVYVVGKVDLENNRVHSTLWLAPTSGKGGAPRQLTSSPKNDRHPRWSPDGRFILFESTRSGSSQIWVVPVGGGDPRQLTNLSTGANTAIWAPNAKHIAFVSTVWPEFSEKPFKESDALNKKRMDERDKSPVKARVFTRLFFRHWDEYVEDKRQHLFVLDLKEGDSGPVADGDPRDVTPGDRDAYPTSSTFSDGDDFTFTPNSQHLIFTAVPEKDEAWNTNYDLCRVPITGGSTRWENLTPGNPAADGQPRFSPDGKWLAYRAQSRPKFEADRWQLMLIATADIGKFTTTGKAKKAVAPKNLTYEYTDAVESFTWLADSETIYFAAQERGKHWYFATNVNRKDGEARLTFLSQHSHQDLTCSRDGKVMAFLRSAFDQPAEVFIAEDRGAEWQVSNLSKANEKVLSELRLAEPETVNVLGAGGTPVQMWILKPPGFDAKKKWPLVYLVHGGPQSAWTDSWSFRWNPQVWAAQGYVIALPNPRGSTGFGQQFVDEITGDWGGKVFEDLMACLSHLEKQPYIDGNRMAAAGASYGGYMMNWFAVNTGKFKTLINHCGVWNFESMYGTTEEIWFDEWEHGGPPWGKNRHSYEKHSPHKLAANLEKFRTPMLIIHNDLDFRVPVSEGIQVFTTLQRMGIPSRFVNFPDEGHWVLKPRNSQYWHQEVFAWLRKHVAPGGK